MPVSVNPLKMGHAFSTVSGTMAMGVLLTRPAAPRQFWSGLCLPAHELVGGGALHEHLHQGSCGGIPLEVHGAVLGGTAKALGVVVLGVALHEHLHLEPYLGGVDLAADLPLE